MACKRLKIEDSNGEIGDETRQMDIISQLEGVPHVLEEIFLYLDTATVSEAEEVSTAWKRLITSLDLWKWCVWKKNMRMSSTWKALSARMEYFQPQLSDRMKEGDSSSYKEACRYVEGNIRQISQSGMKNFNFQALANENGILNKTTNVIRMNDNYVFIGSGGKVSIVSRWTHQVVKEFVSQFCSDVYDMQLNERFLVVQLHNENVEYDQIDVYDVQKLMHIQMLVTNKINHRLRKNFNFQALANENDTLNNTARVIRMNEKYIFIGGKGIVSIFNRWNRQLVKDFVGQFVSDVYDMQLNERFLVVQLHNENVEYDQIDVYDVQKLVYIQTLVTNKIYHGLFYPSFGLGSNVLFICETSKRLDHLLFHVHRWNPSAAQFVRDTETEDRPKVALDDEQSRYSRIYVDEKYLIADFTYFREDNVRHIRVFSLETMQLVRERQFVDRHYKFFTNHIRHEYHDGGIVVNTCRADGQPCVALWDVDKDTVQPMADHPTQFEYSIAMTHHPFQIVFKKRENPQQLLLVQRRGQLTRNSGIAMPSQCWVHTPDLNLRRKNFIFDGLQMIAIIEHNTSSYRSIEWKIMMADLVG